MAIRAKITILCDWAALVGAVGMVVFLTFAPRQAPSPVPFEAGTARHAEIDWPSRTAALDEGFQTRR